MQSLSVSSMVDLLNVDTSTLSAGDRVTTVSYHPPLFPSAYFYGGRSYIWLPDHPQDAHDGGTYISPEVPWDGSLAGRDDFINGAGAACPCDDGCFVLEHPVEVFVEDYGAVGNSNDDDWLSINAALSRHLRFIHGSHIIAGKVKLREASYYLTQHLNIKTEVHFEGVAGASVLNFPPDVGGIIVHRDDTIDYTTVDPPTGDSKLSTIKNMVLMGDKGTDATRHGILLRHTCEVSHVWVEDFVGNGISIVATTNSSDPSKVGNANGWSLSHIKSVGNMGHGVFVDGGDVNAGYGYKVDCTSNGGWGIYDSSFLGNTWSACHTANNTLGAYLADNPNARSVLLGCYAEGNQPGSYLQPPSIAIGGLYGSGLEGAYIDGDDVSVRDIFASRQVKVTKGDSDYAENFVAFNDASAGPHNRREVGYMGYSGFKEDGVTPRPLGGLALRPQGTGRDEQTVIDFYVYDGEGSDDIIEVAHFWGTKDFTPENDNTTQMGWSGDAWRTLYLNHAPLIPADADLSENVAPLTTAEQNVATALKGLVRTYTRKADSDGVRHIGVMAEDVVTAFQNEGLNAYDYGILESGERDHLRYEELLAFIIATL